MEFLEEFVFRDLRDGRRDAGIVVAVTLADSEDLYLEFASSYASAYGLRVSPDTIRELTASLGASLGKAVHFELSLVGLDSAACSLITSTHPGRYGAYGPGHGREPELVVLLHGNGFAHAAVLDRRETREFHNALAEAYDVLHA